ncbi:MAG TPA: response regulator transcription factor [Ignavibacteriales bacterium]|mgnify:FL=1|nr:response regulator transcription factor [Ignavibacteriales bacterium]HOL81806.1 response regulator transcription factor [Ignavibacteriales bacterium]HPP33943.1 response regulator transcription factor [Ignavibacteriales bacterium]HRT99201.1 response regulator transcription factor [Ignavibacteriales bacterium]
MRTKILLVDDEKDIVEFLQYNLEKEGFEVIVAYDGEEALRRVNEMPDLIVLDIMLPKINGFDVCKRIRMNERYEGIPIIILTAKNTEIDEILGLELGANDYIVKPISPQKLIVRIKANLKKIEKSNIQFKPNQIVIGPVVIDREKYSIFIDKEEISLTRKEFDLIYYLANQQGKVINREVLLKEVWGEDIYVVERTVDVHVRKIREKLGDYANIIETVKGVGYRFKEIKELRK